MLSQMSLFVAPPQASTTEHPRWRSHPGPSAGLSIGNTHQEERDSAGEYGLSASAR